MSVAVESGEGNGTPLQSSCLEKSHGRKSLVGCSPWGREKSDTTEQLHFHFHHHALQKEMATHSRFLAWRIPGTGLPSMWSHRVGHNWSDLTAAAVESKGKLFWVNILEQQLKTEPLSDPATPLLGLYLKEMKPVSQRYFHDYS